MKTSQFAGLIAAILAGAMIVAGVVHAQSYGSVAFGPIAPAISNCPAGLTGGASLCVVGTSAANYALYVSYNGGAYQALVPTAAPAGVASFNGRTGTVTLTKADVTGTGIAATATTTAPSTTVTLQ